MVSRVSILGSLKDGVVKEVPSDKERDRLTKEFEAIEHQYKMLRESRKKAREDYQKAIRQFSNRSSVTRAIFKDVFDKAGHPLTAYDVYARLPFNRTSSVNENRRLYRAVCSYLYVLSRKGFVERMPNKICKSYQVYVWKKG